MQFRLNCRTMYIVCNGHTYIQYHEQQAVSGPRESAAAIIVYLSLWANYGTLAATNYRRNSGTIAHHIVHTCNLDWRQKQQQQQLLELDDAQTDIQTAGQMMMDDVVHK